MFIETSCIRIELAPEERHVSSDIDCSAEHFAPPERWSQIERPFYKHAAPPEQIEPTAKGKFEKGEK
jgi:hypothetical protein